MVKGEKVKKLKSERVMKNIIKFLGVLLAVVLMGTTFTACSEDDGNGSANLGLGIKVFFPTKVVTNQPITINGSGFNNVTEIVFPGGVKATNFEIVSNDMIRVDAPSGIAADGGKIVVRTADDEAESPLPLTIGHTIVSGYSKQAGESAVGGDLITVYGTDLEFINSIELLDADGNPQLIDHKDFYRKGTSNLIFSVPLKNIFKGSFIGHLYTYDGQIFDLPELAYEPNAGGGHWELQEKVIWEGLEDLSGGAQPYIGSDAGAEFINNAVEAGQMLRFYIEPVGDGWWFEVFEGHWGPQYGKWTNETNPEITTGDSNFIELEATQAMIDAALVQQWWGGIFVVQGAVKLTKVTVLQEVWIEGEGGEAGGDKVTTIWDTETVFGDWSATVAIDAAQFADVRAGDIIRVYYKDKGDDYLPIFKHVDSWGDWNELQGVKNEQDGYFEATVPADAVDELKEKGLRFQGLGFTITKVDLIQPGAGGGSSSGPAIIWDTETVFGDWSATIVIDAAQFASAKAGDIVRVYIKDKGNDYNPIYKHVSSWGDWNEFQSNKTDTDEYFEAPIPADALEELNSEGLRFQGVGFTIVKVELIQ